MNNVVYYFIFPFLAFISAALFIATIYSKRILYYQIRHEILLKNMNLHLQTKNNTTTLAILSLRLQMFIWIYLSSDLDKRDAIRVMMIDYQNDIIKRLNDAKENNEGFEEGLLIDVVLDAAIKTNKDLKIILEQLKGFERTAFEVLMKMNSKSLEILKLNGTDFIKRYNEQWQEIIGKEKS